MTLPEVSGTLFFEAAAATCSPAASCRPVRHVAGDLNGDGQVTVVDTQTIAAVE